MDGLETLPVKITRHPHTTVGVGESFDLVAMVREQHLGQGPDASKPKIGLAYILKKGGKGEVDKIYNGRGAAPNRKASASKLLTRTRGSRSGASPGAASQSKPLAGT